MVFTPVLRFTTFLSIFGLLWILSPRFLNKPDRKKEGDDCRALLRRCAQSRQCDAGREKDLSIEFPLPTIVQNGMYINMYVIYSNMYVDYDSNPQKDRNVFPGWYMFPLNFRVCNFFFTIYFGFAVYIYYIYTYIYIFIICNLGSFPWLTILSSDSWSFNKLTEVMNRSSTKDLH